MLAEAEAIFKERKEKIKARKNAALNGWLLAHGGETTFAKIEAGYACTGEIKSLVSEWVKEQIDSLDLDLHFVCKQIEDVRDRTSPSDAAFAAQIAINKLSPLFCAVVKWAVCDDEDDDEFGKPAQEIIELNVACPWDSSNKDYLYLQIESSNFAE